MVRSNTRASSNYGATSSASPPPPYSGFVPPTGQFNGWAPVDVDPPRSSLLPTFIAWTNTRSFVAFLTFIVAVGVCMATMPVTYCNDPADPQVRERIRKEWSKELLEYEKHAAEREVTKARWALEDERHAALLHEWEQERVQHEEQLKERARREEEERRRLDLFWGRVEAHQCKTYGTRKYTAVLMNLPMNWGRRVEACRATPLEVHGVARTPTTCEDAGHGVVIGRWDVDQNEPDCNTYWNWYKDKESYPLSHALGGCTSRGSGKKRIEHYLENLPSGGDWREFCATTPARFHGMEFFGAQECFQYNLGTYGHWEIDDINC